MYSTFARKTFAVRYICIYLLYMYEMCMHVYILYLSAWCYHRLEEIYHIGLYYLSWIVLLSWVTYLQGHLVRWMVKCGSNK